MHAGVLKGVLVSGRVRVVGVGDMARVLAVFTVHQPLFLCGAYGLDVLAAVPWELVLVTGRVLRLGQWPASV